MEVAAVKMSSLEKLVVIQYDEMKIMPIYEHDSVNDIVLGPHSQAHFIMVRSLIGSWKQPIFTEFDSKKTKAYLDEIIAKLYAIGFTVVAIVSDCGGGNVGVWKEYKVSHEKSFFFSSITNRNIYFFADVPHILKLIRNRFIDGGFVLPNGVKISPEPVKILIEKTNSLEISSCHKLTPKHFYCEKIQRRNMLLAAQVMSNSTACALRRYDVCDESLRTATENFIKLTNDCFDVMNSRFPNASLNLQCGYGIHLYEQKKVLENYIETMEQITCIEKTSDIVENSDVKKKFLTSKETLRRVRKVEKSTKTFSKRSDNVYQVADWFV